MSITEFGHCRDPPLREIHLRGACDMEATVLTCGAVLRKLLVPLGEPAALPDAARPVAPIGGLATAVITTETESWFYAGMGLQPSAKAHGGGPQLPYLGLCPEPQRYPDSVNHPHPSPLVPRPGETCRQVTRFRFLSPP